MHEASLSEANAFITLTYDDDHLPADRSLDRRAFPLFMKRLRKTGAKVRYFHCGEYGELEWRPHYHACLFGFDFEDKELWKERHGLPVWRSRGLESLWPFGMSEIGTVTFGSAAYVARYITKKITGRNADEHYERFDARTGESYQLEPEYTTMSRRPGIGRGWVEKWSGDVFPSDEVIVDGKSVKPPRYYEGELGEEELKLVKRERKRSMRGRDNSPARLAARESVAKARLNLYPRGDM